MLIKGSRYEKAKAFSFGRNESPVFKGIRPRAIGPATGVLEHIVREGDRLDLLALYYYNDARKWWRIIDANPDILFAGDLLMASSFEMTKQSFENLKKAEEIPSDVLGNLEHIIGKEIIGEEEFLQTIQRTIGEEQTLRYKGVILKYAQSKDRVGTSILIPRAEEPGGSQ